MLKKLANIFSDYINVYKDFDFTECLKLKNFRAFLKQVEKKKPDQKKLWLVFGTPLFLLVFLLLMKPIGLFIESQQINDPYQLIAFFVEILKQIEIPLAITESYKGILFTAFAVLMGLMFNLLVILFDILNSQDWPENDMVEKEFNYCASRVIYLKQTFSVISFSIFVSISIIVCLLSTLILSFIEPVITVVVYYLSLIFMVTCFQILGRTHLLLNSQFRKE